MSVVFRTRLNISRGAFEDFEAAVYQPSQSGLVHRPASLHLLQRSEQGTAHAAGAVRPIRIDRDAFKAGQQHFNQLNLLGKLHG